MTRYILLVVFAIFLSQANAQVFERFGAGLIGGMTASQIDGDDLAGYNKLGFTAGIRGTAEIKPWLDFAVELLYSQRGSRSEARLSTSPSRRKIELGYIELPLMIILKDWKYNADSKRNSYYKVRALAGISVGRLISASSFDNSGLESFDDNLADAFNSNDLGFLIGLGYNFTKNLGIEGRFNRSMNKLFVPEGDTPLAPSSMVGYFFSFTLQYEF